MNQYWDKVIDEAQLIAMPEVYLKLQQTLQNQDFSLQDIVEIIKLDPAITARLLQLVNSSYFGLAARIETVSHAVNYLGAQQVHDLVLTSSIARTFSKIEIPEFDMYRYWQCSVYNAIVARELAAVCNVLDSERLFIDGLLADIGHLMMYQSIPEAVDKAAAQARAAGKPQYLAERELIGFDATMLATRLLTDWHLPQTLTETIRHRLEPAEADVFALESSILHISGFMTEAFDNNASLEEALVRMDRFALDKTGADPEQLNHVDDTARTNLNSVLEMLFPSAQSATG